MSSRSRTRTNAFTSSLRARRHRRVSVASSDARAGTNEDAPPPGTLFGHCRRVRNGRAYKDTRAPARSANALAEAKSASETSAMSSSTDWVHPERSRADTGATHSGTEPSAVNS